MTKPKITVIIPTRERSDVLEKSLKTVTAQNYENLEIIVSDNFSCDDTEMVVRNASDSRVKYINTGKRVCMSHNFEFALSKVSHGWVAIIGDDDGLLPNSLERVGEIIQNTGTRAIRTSHCNYSWPSTTGKSFGRLGVPLKSGLEVRNSRNWLDRLLNGKAWYTDMPCLYQGGFIEMSVVHEIMRKTGSFYKSSQPDLYSGVAVSNVVDAFIYSHEPFAINGNSRHSTGASFINASRGVDPTPSEKFWEEENIPLHKDIPLLADGTVPKSIQVLVYEAYLQALALQETAGTNIAAKQLRLILETAGPHEASINNWGERFAELHGLNFRKIAFQASILKYKAKIFSAVNRPRMELSTCRVGSKVLPLLDVCEASMAASAILKFKPTKIYIAGQIMKRITEKGIESIKARGQVAA